MSPADRPSSGASIVDVLDRVLDKGIVIDAWVRVSLVGIDLLTVEARVLVASIETYKQQAKAVAEVVSFAASHRGALAASHCGAIDPSSKGLPKAQVSSKKAEMPSKKSGTLPKTSRPLTALRQPLSGRMSGRNTTRRRSPSPTNRKS
jgi:hypothetical protein